MRKGQEDMTAADRIRALLQEAEDVLGVRRTTTNLRYQQYEVAAANQASSEAEVRELKAALQHIEGGGQD